MALEADYQGIENYRDLEPVRRDSLAIATMIVGINKITKENARKFYVRVRTYERVGSALMYGDNGAPVYVTPADVKRHIGLSSNASPKTDAKWRADVARWAAEDAEKEWDRETT